MKLNNSYIGVLFQTNPLLADFYKAEHLNEEKHKVDVMIQPELAAITGAYYDGTITDAWQMRVDITNALAKPAAKVYYITDSVKSLVDSSVKIDKVELKWFKQLPSLDAMYITGKDEFFRFQKTDTRINVLHYVKNEIEYRYDCFSIILNDGMLATMPQYNDRNRAEFFVKLLLFMEMGETTIRIVKPSEKYKYGKKGDEQVKNEAGIEVIMVTTDWNKIVVVEGDFNVSAHLRIQRVGKGRMEYAMVWVSEYTKHGYIRRGKNQLN